RVDTDHSSNGGGIWLKDYGLDPFVVNINEATLQNNTYRTALWTGTHLQVTLMSLKAGEDIGLEMHPDLDQFIRIEQCQGIVEMGQSKDNLNFKRYVYDDSAIVIPQVVGDEEYFNSVKKDIESIAKSVIKTSTLKII
ncbi:MAG TPA: hypothetical protein VI423_08615, partial [Paenisporosarcina sp.]|nr:hypothetical protein [Paenisporosarcina sp.]